MLIGASDHDEATHFITSLYYIRAYDASAQKETFVGEADALQHMCGGLTPLPGCPSGGGHDGAPSAPSGSGPTGIGPSDSGPGDTAPSSDPSGGPIIRSQAQWEDISDTRIHTELDGDLLDGTIETREGL